MTEALSAHQRQMLALALAPGLGPPLIPGAAPIVGPDMQYARRPDTVNMPNPFTVPPDPMMNIKPVYRGDRILEMQDRPWDNNLLLRNT